MKQTVNYSKNTIAVIKSLNWLNNLSLNQLKNDIKQINITNNPTSLNKFMYEEWCMAKLKNKRVE